MASAAIRSKSEYDQEIPRSHNADKPLAPEEGPQSNNSHKTSGAEVIKLKYSLKLKINVKCSD